MSGEVVYIHITGEAGGKPSAVDSVVAEEGKGLVGDRYHDSAGTYSDTPGSGRHVTMIESEAVEALEKEFGVKLAPGCPGGDAAQRSVSVFGRHCRAAERPEWAR
jgi:hypothetical protein